MRAHTHTERERERETPRTLYRCRPCAVIKYRQLTKHFTGWHDWQLLSTLRNFQLAIWQSHDTSQNILLCLFWYCIYSSCDASCYHTSAETRCTDDRSDRKHISTQWTWMKVSSLDTGLKSTKWHSLLRSACISRILAVTSVVRKLTIRNLCIMYPVNPRKTKSLLFVFYTNKLQYFCKSLSLVYVDRFLPRDAISAITNCKWRRHITLRHRTQTCWWLYQNLFAQNTIKIDNGYVNEQDRKTLCALASAHNITSTVTRNR